mmetsp:Transcript_12509/g.52427  ORF Transcript_12509/g.52427 Transcript_12509/m.52427 type:complete len:494 (-) Transcript_12509:3276-4757(-)
MSASVHDTHSLCPQGRTASSAAAADEDASSWHTGHSNVFVFGNVVSVAVPVPFASSASAFVAFVSSSSLLSRSRKRTCDAARLRSASYKARSVTYCVSISPSSHSCTTDALKCSGTGSGKPPSAISSSRRVRMRVVAMTNSSRACISSLWCFCKTFALRNSRRISSRASQCALPDSCKRACVSLQTRPSRKRSAVSAELGAERPAPTSARATRPRAPPRTCSSEACLPNTASSYVTRSGCARQWWHITRSRSRRFVVVVVVAAVSKKKFRLSRPPTTHAPHRPAASTSSGLASRAMRDKRAWVSKNADRDSVSLWSSRSSANANPSRSVNETRSPCQLPCKAPSTSRSNRRALSRELRSSRRASASASTHHAHPAGPFVFEAPHRESADDTDAEILRRCSAAAPTPPARDKRYFRRSVSASARSESSRSDRETATAELSSPLSFAPFDFVFAASSAASSASLRLCSACRRCSASSRSPSPSAAPEASSFNTRR